MSRKHRQRHLGKRTLGEGNWLRLEEVEYLDHNGTARTWEATVRRGPGGAAFMIARLVPSERYILVRQYRPPADGLVLEFPAGLLDPARVRAGARAARTLRGGAVAGGLDRALHGAGRRRG